MDIKKGDMVTTYSGDGWVESIEPDGTVVVHYDNSGEMGRYNPNRLEPATFHPYTWREISRRTEAANA